MRIVLACLVALAAACAEAKTLRYASQFDPGTMDPHALASLYNTRVLAQVYESLVFRDEQFKPEPKLALSWTPLEGGKGWRFKLRPNVKFHEGEPFNADDVVFNVERAMASTSAYKTAIPNVTGAKRVDDLTVDIFTSQPTPVLPLEIMNLRLMSKGWCAKHHVEKPQDYKAKEESYAARNANGTGPYKLVRWDTDVKTVLAANDKYWGKRGNVTEAIYYVITSPATRVAALISGEMDFVIDPAAQDLDRLQKAGAATVEQQVSVGTQFIGFDYKGQTLKFGDAGGRNPFLDVRVREAVRYAVDVKALQSKVMRGTSGVGRSFFSPACDGFDKRFEAPAAYDPAKAKVLLKEAGYPNGFSVDLDCSAQQPADAICQAVSGMLSRIGIRVAYRPLPFNILLPKLIKGDTSLYVIGWSPVTAEPEGVFVPLVHSRNMPGVGEYNFGGYSNPRIDALIDKGRVEFDGARRNAIFSEVMTALDADAAFIPLVYRNVTWAMRKNVKARLRPNDVVDLRFVNVE